MYSKVIQLYIFFHILFYSSLLQNIEYNSLCYTVGPSCSSILYIVVCICYLIVVLIWISPMTHDHLFICIFAICIFFWWVSLQIFCPFFNRLFIFLLLNFNYSLYILKTSPISDMCFTNIFLQKIWLVFFLRAIFCKAQVFNFNEVLLNQFFLSWIMYFWCHI